MKKDIFNTQIANIRIPQSSTLQRHYFPDMPNLRDVHLFGLESFSVGSLTNDPNNVAVVNDALIQCTYLTLVNAKSDQFIYRFPLINLIRTQNNTAAPFVSVFGLNEFAGQETIFTKSFIEIANTGTISGAQDESVVFNIYFKYKQYKGVRYQG